MAVSTLRRLGPPALLAIAAAGMLATAGLLYLRSPARVGLHALAATGPVKLSAVVNASGVPVSIDSFRGKVVILNLWAAWCAPCLEEMPSLDRLAGKLPQQAFAVVAVAVDPPGDTASSRAFTRMSLAHLALYLDPPPGRLAKEVGARGTPTTVILGPDGSAISYREGATDWDSDEMVVYLRGLGPAS